jgi:hypothetical protein
VKETKKQNCETKPPVYTCLECGSSDMIIDEFNAEDREGVGDAEFAERELGNHGTMTCQKCGNTQEYDE